MSRGAGSGPPGDLTAFYAEQFDRVRGSLVLFTGSRDVGEELAQEAFVRACQHWEKVRAMDAPGAWVHRVGINLAISRGRKRTTERRILDRLRTERPPVPSAPSDDGSEVASALAKLPDDDRAVVVLRYHADLSVAATAQVLSIPEGTVKTRTRRALAALREGGLLASAVVDGRGEREPAGRDGGEPEDVVAP